jgi:hypothetical protein
MNTFFTFQPGSQRLDAVEDALRRSREDAQLRLARAQNNPRKANLAPAKPSSRPAQKR